MQFIMCWYVYANGPNFRQKCPFMHDDRCAVVPLLLLPGLCHNLTRIQPPSPITHAH